MNQYNDASISEINLVMDAAKAAAPIMRKLSLSKRAELMNAIADSHELIFMMLAVLDNRNGG